MKKGIDISKWQGFPEFLKVKRSGIEFVILRSSYGSKLDSRFMGNVYGCMDADLAVPGVYHFSYALTTEDAKSEARFCIEAVKTAGLSKDTVIFFDLEYDSVDYAKKKGVNIDRDRCIAHTEAFCEEVIKLGYKPGVYFNGHYYKTMYTPETLDKYIKWLADWTGSPDYVCDVHQYSSSGKVPGISGNVDMNNWISDYITIDNDKEEVQKTTDEIVIEVFKGLWDNGTERINKLVDEGYDWRVIQDAINRYDAIANNTIAGKYGNGEDRKAKITSKGLNYEVIQSIVNIKLEE